MNKIEPNISLLLVDDDQDFRASARRILERRGLSVTEASNGEECLASIESKLPDVIVLDLKMPGLSGIETLREIRSIDASLPVIILTGHGDFEAAVSGIRLSIVDFLQKPVDMDELAFRIRALLERGRMIPLDEPTITGLMASPSEYPRLYVDESVTKALELLKGSFTRTADNERIPMHVRSALVYDRSEKFIGIIRFSDLLKLVLPPFLEGSAYTTYFTGMFLAQCKVVSKRTIGELMGEMVYVDDVAPLMEAIHLMVKHHLVNLLVMREKELVGILRERDIILQIAGVVGGSHLRSE